MVRYTSRYSEKLIVNINQQHLAQNYSIENLWVAPPRREKAGAFRPPHFLSILLRQCDHIHLTEFGEGIAVLLGEGLCECHDLALSSVDVVIGLHISLASVLAFVEGDDDPLALGIQLDVDRRGLASTLGKFDAEFGCQIVAEVLRSHCRFLSVGVVPTLLAQSLGNEDCIAWIGLGIALCFSMPICGHGTAVI